jgi:RND family efflux transporter MFP subunit
MLTSASRFCDVVGMTRREFAMDERLKLLDDLRIDGRDDYKLAGLAWPYKLTITLVVVVACGAWWAWAKPHTVQVNAATAVAAPLRDTRTPNPSSPSEFDASGYVVARRQATVSAKTTGRLIEMGIEEGQRVTEGEIIARLDDSSLSAAVRHARALQALAEAELTAAQVARENARPTFERNAQQFGQGIISEQVYDDAKASFQGLEASVAVRERAVAVAEANVALAERNYEDTFVRAPFDGIVSVKAAQAGEIVSPVSGGGGFTRTGIGTIVDMSSLEVEVDVSESFINRVRPSQPARVRLNAYPDWEIPAHVIAIVPTADRARATVKVRVGFSGIDERVLPDMGARVSFLSASPAEGSDSGRSGRAGVLVPVDAVIAGEGDGIVFVIEDGTIKRRTVQLGPRTNEGQLVLRGLMPGARVVLGDLAQRSDGEKVRVSD